MRAAKAPALPGSEEIAALALGQESWVYHSQLSPLQRPAVGAEFGQAHVADSFAAFDGFAAGPDCAAGGGARGQGEGGATVGVAVGAVGGAVGDLAGRRTDTVEGMEVFADHSADGYAQGTLFKGHPQFGENLHLEGVGKIAQFDFAEFVARRVVLAEFLGQVIAQADAGAGVIEADATRFP